MLNSPEAKRTGDKSRLCEWAWLPSRYRSPHLSSTVRIDTEPASTCWQEFGPEFTTLHYQRKLSDSAKLFTLNPCCSPTPFKTIYIVLNGAFKFRRKFFCFFLTRWIGKFGNSHFFIKTRVTELFDNEWKPKTLRDIRPKLICKDRVHFKIIKSYIIVHFISDSININEIKTF